MTEAALARTLIELRQQLSLASSGTLELTPALLSQIGQAITDIETELREREIDPAEVQPGSMPAFADGKVVRFVTLSEED